MGKGRNTGARVTTARAGRFELNSGTAVAAAVVIGAVLRLVDIGAQSYSMDEIWEFTVIRLPAREIVKAGDGFPPLFHLMIHAMFAGGLGDISARVLSAILGIVTVWLASRLGRRIDPKLGAAAAFAVAVAPLLVLLSKEGRAYGLFILLAGLLLLATWDVIDTNTPRAWSGFIVVAVLGMYTHYMFSLALVAAEIVIIYSMGRDPARWRRWLFGHCVLAVLLIPLVYVAIPDFGLDASNDYSPTVGTLEIGYAGLSLFTGTTLGPSTRALHTVGSMDAIRSALPWVLMIGLPALYLVYLGWRALSTDWRIRLGVPFVVPVVLLSAISALVGTAFRVRYLSWLVLPLALWLAAGWLRGKGTLRHVAVGLLVLSSVIAMVTRDTIDDYRVEDARGAAQYIADHPDLPAVGMAWYMTRPIEYYLGLTSATALPATDGPDRFLYHQEPDDRIVPLPNMDDESHDVTAQDKVLDAAVPLGQEYLFVVTRQFHADPDGTYFDHRVAEDGLVPVAHFAGITIYKGVRGS